MISENFVDAPYTPRAVPVELSRENSNHNHLESLSSWWKRVILAGEPFGPPRLVMLPCCTLPQDFVPGLPLLPKDMDPPRPFYELEKGRASCRAILN